jgi:hypothetical protein
VERIRTLRETRFATSHPRPELELGFSEFPTACYPLDPLSPLKQGPSPR